MATVNYTTRVEDGTKTAPGYSFRQDTDSGLYRIGANNLGISCGDSKIVDINTSGLNAIIGATTPAAGAFTTGSFSGVASFAAGAVDAPSLARTGDLNTGFWFPADNTIAASVNGVEGIRLTTTGLGVGVTPSFKLDADGDINTTGSYRLAGGATIGIVGGHTYVSSPSGKDLILYTNAGANERFRIQSDGNMVAQSGIGTELVSNGSFTGSADGWTLGTGWAYGADAVQKNADGTGTLSQALAPTPNETYLITFTISGLAVGSVNVNFGGNDSPSRSANGTYTFYMTAKTTDVLSFAPTSTSRFTIDEVSVRQLTTGQLLSLAGRQIAVPDGGPTLPGLASINDPTTGLYFYNAVGSSFIEWIVDGAAKHLFGWDVQQTMGVTSKHYFGDSFEMYVGRNADGDLLLSPKSGRSVLADGKIGYGTGAGGAVEQATSRTTGVTLDKVCGAITLFSAAGSTTPASFTVTNSTVAATDVIRLSQKSGTDKYVLLVTAVAAGSFEITAYTTGGTTTEQPVINFAVFKAVVA